MYLEAQQATRKAILKAVSELPGDEVAEWRAVHNLEESEDISIDWLLLPYWTEVQRACVANVLAENMLSTFSVGTAMNVLVAFERRLCVLCACDLTEKVLEFQHPKHRYAASHVLDLARKCIRGEASPEDCENAASRLWGSSARRSFDELAGCVGQLACDLGDAETVVGDIASILDLCIDEEFSRELLAHSVRTNIHVVAAAGYAPTILW